MTEDLSSHFPFLAFRTKQNVAKSKLGGEFARKGWNVLSAGFSESTLMNGEQTSCANGKEPVEKSKLDPELFKKQILTERYRPKKRKPKIDDKEAEYFVSKVKDFCTVIHKKSVQAENQKDLKTCTVNKCSNSVFLEVQNIQNTFLQNKYAHQQRTCIKFSEFRRNIIVNDTKKTAGQENVPKKSRFSECQFILPENDFSPSVSVKKVQKTTIFSDPHSPILKKIPIGVKNKSEPITNSKLAPSDFKSHNKISDDVKFNIDTRKGLGSDQNQNKNLTFNLSTLLEVESTKSKGSSWLQSLQICDDEVLVQEDGIGKKKIRNILTGGFAEQMLKLQRIEKSEEVIWNHNMDRNKKKAGVHLPLMLMSVSKTDNIVITKCLSLRTETSNRMNPEVKDSLRVSEEPIESKRVLVLLKRNAFKKLHLKVGSIFHLYPPWQTLHLPSMSCPLILCTKFIDFISNTSELIPDRNSCSQSRLFSPSSSSTLASNQASHCNNEISCQWGKSLSLRGRIQRIWKRETPNKNVSHFPSIPKYCRYSLLVQEQLGVFYELVLLSVHCLSNFWKEFISQAEGKCYQFCNLRVINKFCLKKHTQFFRVLDSLSKQQGNEDGLKQEFCYQLTFDNPAVMPEAVNDEFPAYCSFYLQPLARLCREMNIQRFTCVGKIIFQYKKTFYLCDDTSPQYVRLEIMFPVESKSLLVGSVILVREAHFLEGSLFLDNYSSFIQISKDFEMDERLKHLCRKKFQQLTSISLQNVIPSINAATENTQFALITGEIISVDENNATSWLQCNLCCSENLLQDSSLAIYCENCFEVVTRPVLNVKMSVTCLCSPHVKVEIELLSRTIKRILQISNDTFQPRCNVVDVLGQQIGPVFCYIKSFTTLGDVKEFLVSEIDPSCHTSS